MVTVKRDTVYEVFRVCGRGRGRLPEGCMPRSDGLRVSGLPGLSRFILYGSRNRDAKPSGKADGQA